VPLLVAAEQAGLRPRYGCRMGICHTCSCVKRAGTVQNFLTGEISSEPGERIQLCISHAVSDLTIDL
jgi:ferredoxin